MGGGGGRGTSHICGVLPLGSEDGALSCVRVSGHSAQIGMASGTLHVTALALHGGGSPGGDGSAAPMQKVYN